METKRIDNSRLEKRELTLGFIPLTDCAPLVVAKELGWFEKYGLDVTLSKETSWANIRDKVALGILDAAQMLAPMPLAMSLGLGPMSKPMVTSLSLGLNGNAITVSNDLYNGMSAADPMAMAERPLTARALRKLIEQHREAGNRPLTFATVFPYSSHSYQLRYWLAAAGIDPDRDVRLVVVPPPQMVGQLASGAIDGYCVGEPWNSQAVQQGVGHTLISSYEIWNNGPEKVLGVTEEWAEQYPNSHQALLQALLEASRWLDQPQNRRDAAALIAAPHYVNAPESVVRMSLSGTFQYADDELARSLPDFNVFHRYAANYPWRSHAVWFLTQMVRWGELTAPCSLRKVAERVYRPAPFREAAAALGIVAPAIDYKLEGRHGDRWKLHEGEQSLLMGSDRFLDETHFDPSRPIDYLNRFTVHAEGADLIGFGALNIPEHDAGQPLSTPA